MHMSNLCTVYTPHTPLTDLNPPARLFLSENKHLNTTTTTILYARNKMYSLPLSMENKIKKKLRGMSELLTQDTKFGLVTKRGAA